MKNLISKILFTFSLLIMTSVINAQIINLTVTKIGNTTVNRLTQGFQIANIGRVITFETGSSFFYKDISRSYYVTVAETVAQVAALTGSVDLIPSSLAKRVVLLFDATGGKAIATYHLTQLNGESFQLPDNARITSADYEVQTTFTSAGDSATISLGISTDDVAGLVAAVAISTGTPWDAGVHDGIQTATASTLSEKTTAATRYVDAVVGTTALTAGKLSVIVDYVILE